MNKYLPVLINRKENLKIAFDLLGARIGMLGDMLKFEANVHDTAPEGFEPHELVRMIDAEMIRRDQIRNEIARCDMMIERARQTGN